MARFEKKMLMETVVMMSNVVITERRIEIFVALCVLASFFLVLWLLCTMLTTGAMLLLFGERHLMIATSTSLGATIGIFAAMLWSY